MWLFLILIVLSSNPYIIYIYIYKHLYILYLQYVPSIIGIRSVDFLRTSKAMLELWERQWSMSSFSLRWRALVSHILFKISTYLQDLKWLRWHFSFPQTPTWWTKILYDYINFNGYNSNNMSLLFSQKAHVFENFRDLEMTFCGHVFSLSIFQKISESIQKESLDVKEYGWHCTFGTFIWWYCRTHLKDNVVS